MRQDIELGMKTSEILSEIADERARQIGVEGWTPDHDDEHKGGELIRAAICYAHHPITHPLAMRQLGSGKPCDMWPFEASWWKPKDPRRDLIRSAALIVAEIERLDRLALKAETGTETDLSAKGGEA